MFNRDEPVLMTAADRLHRVGYVVSCNDDGVIVQPTAFEGSPLQYPAETRHSVLQRDVVRLRELPSSREVGGILFEQVGGGGVMAAELIVRESNGRWTAHVGLCRGARVASGCVDPSTSPIGRRPARSRTLSSRNGEPRWLDQRRSTRKGEFRRSDLRARCPGTAPNVWWKTRERGRLSRESVSMDKVRDLVAVRRRHPATCLYCAASPDSEEHALPHAMGGRLRAPILCPSDNNVVSRADNALSTWFAPFTQMLMVPKQRGGRGTSFVAPTDDGRMLKMEADGRVVDRSQMAKKDEQGRILHAVGSDRWTGKLQAAKEKSGPGPWMPRIVIPGGRETVTVSLGLPRQIEPGLVKAALHFVAGFMDHVVVPDELREIVFRNEPSEKPGVYVRPLRADSPLFGESWPPSHKMTAYPGPDGTYVTIMLYGVFGMVVRLPDVRISHALRYVQHFDGTGPVLIDFEPRLVPWKSARISAQKEAAFYAALEERLARIHRFNEARIEHDLCVKAARAANERGKTFRTGFVDLFRAELDIFGLPSEKKDELVEATRLMLDEGRIPWKIPTSFEPGGPTYGDIA